MEVGSNKVQIDYFLAVAYLRRFFKYIFTSLEYFFSPENVFSFPFEHNYLYFISLHFQNRLVILV